MLIEVSDFLSQLVQDEIIIEGVYTMGTHNPKPVVAQLLTNEQKRQVLQAKTLLKNYSSSTNKIYISDFLPLSVQEKRKREKK